MDARTLEIADQLLLIERELRAQGWWDELPPSAKAMASEQPFCVDTMSLEQWLQWIFLPRFKMMLEQGAPLPNASGIQPMAEQVYGVGNAKSQGLIKLLGEFDELISGAD